MKPTDLMEVGKEQKLGIGADLVFKDLSSGAEPYEQLHTTYQADVHSSAVLQVTGITCPFNSLSNPAEHLKLPV